MLALLSHVLGLVTAPGPVAGGAAASSTFGFGHGNDLLGFGPAVAVPLLTGAEYLIPVGVAVGGLHKLMNHQETGGGLLVDMLLKGGGAVLIVQLIKSLSGLP